MTLNDAFIAAETHMLDGEHDNFLAKRFSTPDNAEYPFNREWFWNYMLLNIGHFELIISDLDLLYLNVKSWSLVKLANWQKMYDTLCSEYNPIYNYDRTEEYNEVETAESEADSDVAGYDSGDLVDASHTSGTGKNTRTTNNHLYGNIGVTTTQEMIEQELKLRQNSIYDIITNDFKEQFCIVRY